MSTFLFIKRVDIISDIIKYSIIVPTFNRVERLRGLIDSLKKQTIPKSEYEIIIVNDGSTDSTPLLLEKEASTCKHILLENNGPAYARNRGAKEAKGSILVFTDDDVIVPVDWLERIGEILFDAGIDAIGGSVKNCIDSTIAAAYNDMLLYLLEKYNQDKVYFLLTNNFACRKIVFNTLGGFDERLTIGSEDREFVTRLTTSKYQVEYVPGLKIEHYHNFTLWSFCKHHFRFGRASHLFYTVINADNIYDLKPDTFSNYIKLFSYTFKRVNDYSRYIRISITILSQVFFLSGFLFSSIAGTKNLRANRQGFKITRKIEQD